MPVFNVYLTKIHRARAAAMVHRVRQRGDTQHLRSGQKLGGPPHARGAVAKMSYLTSEVRGSGQECQGATAQEQPRGTTPRPRPGVAAGGRATPRPRSGGCAGAGGPRGAIPHSRSGGAVVRRYPSSKVRSSGCTLLEQP